MVAFLAWPLILRVIRRWRMSIGYGARPVARRGSCNGAVTYLRGSHALQDGANYVRFQWAPVLARRYMSDLVTIIDVGVRPFRPLINGIFKF